jgi:hypothetical protein
VDWHEIRLGLCGWRLVTDCQRYGMAPYICSSL